MDVPSFCVLTVQRGSENSLVAFRRGIKSGNSPAILFAFVVWCARKCFRIQLSSKQDQGDQSCHGRNCIVQQCRVYHLVCS